MSGPERYPRGRARRRLAIGLLLVVQTAFFLGFMRGPPLPRADNLRYEVAGANLADGKGLSLPPEVERDPTVAGWVCARHPEACDPDGTHPTAIYPPGYSIFIAGLYLVFGHSYVVIVAAQLVLLWLLFLLFERIAARYLDSRGYWFALAVATTYPFLAWQASQIMSDQLHTTLFLAALGSLALLRPGSLRGLAFGGLMAAAAFTRPYALPAFLAILLFPTVRRGFNASIREWVVAGVVFLLPFGAWTARNAYWFGKFIPLTTCKLGTSLLITTYEWDLDTFAANLPGGWDWGIEKRYGGDFCATAVTAKTSEEAVTRIRANPGKFAWRMIVHVPRTWVSLGYYQGGMSKAWPLLFLYLGGLFAAGLAGMWLVRREAAWHPFVIAILVYWAGLVPLNVEARRTLPLRLPMLLLAAVVFSRLAAWWAERQDGAAEERPSKRVADEGLSP